MYTIDNCPNFSCCCCAKWKIDAERNECICPKLDHKKVKFYIPYFKCYDCGMHHVICGEFVPKYPHYADFKDWTNFEDYWKVYEKAWLTDGMKNRGIGFTVDGDGEKIFFVPLETWLYGEVVKDGILQATTMGYHVRKIINGVTHYPMMYEVINGVCVDSMEV